MKLVEGFVREVPGFRQRFDYGDRTDGQPVYVGAARMELGDDSTKWIVHYFQYNEAGAVTVIEAKEGAWSARVALFA